MPRPGPRTRAPGRAGGSETERLGGNEKRAREPWAVAALWAAITAAGEALLWQPRIFPGSFAREAHVSDDAFVLLVRLAIPVFAFVIAMLVVSLLRFRARGDRGDGRPIRGNRRVSIAWLAVTTALTVALIINPGLVGLAEMHGHPHHDLTVKVVGARWVWTVSYPDADLTSRDELVLPAGKRVRFEVTSADVLHSFWVPAFRVKMDAVPGRTTVAVVTPDRVGSSASDPSLRLQCAELCGLNHSTMRMPIRVVAPADFETWLAAAKAGQQTGPTCAPSGASLQIAASGLAFDTECLATPAGVAFTITFDNRDEGIPHNITIARDQGFADVVFRGTIFSGPARKTYEVPALDADRYVFRCDVHPSMFGALVVAGGE